jgi:DNA-directed RNA polymerase specialized sigma24 family protein
VVEVAEILGKSRPAVAGLLFRALKTLRNQLTDREGSQA